MKYSNKSYPDLGLFILRLGIGIMFILHGWPKLMAGPELWEKIGGAVSFFGIQSHFTLFGFLAACSETIGGGCLILGLATRPAALMMFFTMLTAASMHILKNHGFTQSSHAIESAIVFLTILFTGPGSFSLDNYISFKNN